MRSSLDGYLTESPTDPAERVRIFLPDKGLRPFSLLDWYLNEGRPWLWTGGRGHAV